MDSKKQQLPPKENALFKRILVSFRAAWLVMEQTDENKPFHDILSYFNRCMDNDILQLSLLDKM